MSNKASTRLEYVESLRFIAAALVLFQHYIEQYSGLPLFHEITQIGPGLSGVVIFFCVSGYVVPMSVRGKIDPLNFMIRRIFRVYPLMLAAFVFLFVAGSAGILAKWSFMADATAYQWLANILLLQEYVGAKPILGVTWTLAVEFVWYGLFALSLWRFGDRAGRILSIALPIIILVLTVASLVLGERVPLGRLNMIYACVLGYQAYLLDSGKISLRTLGLSIIAFLAVTIMSNLVAFGFYHHPQISLWQALWPWILGPLAFFAVVAMPQVRNAKILNEGVLPRWGAASYSIYIFHSIGLAAAAQYTTGIWAGSVVAIGLTAVMSFLGYRYVELKGVKLGQAFLKRFPPVAHGALPPAAR